LYSFKLNLPGTLLAIKASQHSMACIYATNRSSFPKPCGCLRSGRWDQPVLAPKHCLQPAGRAAACLDWGPAQMTEFPSQGFSLMLFFDSDADKVSARSATHADYFA